MSRLRRFLGLDRTADAPGPTRPPAERAADAEREPVAHRGDTINLNEHEYNALMRTIERNRRAAEKLHAMRRDRTIGDAVRAGKITPAMRASFERAFDLDPDAVTAELAGLDPGTAPIRPQAA